MLGVNARAIQNFNINIGTRFAHFHCVDFDETRAIDEHLISTIILKEQSEILKKLTKLSHLNELVRNELIKRFQPRVSLFVVFYQAIGFTLSQTRHEL